MENTAILLTCFNRKEKTIRCLNSLFHALSHSVTKIKADIYLVDDGSTDGTAESVNSQFANVNVINGNGDLFWSGGMRLAWQNALDAKKKYDSYLLLNDDVVLNVDFIDSLLNTHKFCLKTYDQPGIYVSSTNDDTNTNMSYGGTLITRKGIRITTVRIKPQETPVKCSMANANILFVTDAVVKSIGILDSYYIHQFGDYDYTLMATKRGIPVLVCPGIGGRCSDDHGNSWLPVNSTLKERLKYLHSPLGLGYSEQLYYLKKNFKYQFPYYFSMLWLKTLFPFIWEKLKVSSDR